MQYILVENRQVVHLGPVDWIPRRIQSEIDEHEIDYTVALKPQGRIVLEKGFEIFPIEKTNKPNYNELYQYLAGPFYTYSDTSVEMSYTVHDHDIEKVRYNLKQVVGSMRYAKENSGITIVINGVSVPLITERSMRHQYTVLLSSSDQQINYKVGAEFISLNKQQVQSMVDAVVQHIQQSFTWEKEMCDEIDAATSISHLQAVEQRFKE